MLIRKLWHDEAGATAIEYGLLIGLIATAMIAGGLLSGSEISATFNTVGSSIENATS